MAGLEYPCEAEITDLSHETTFVRSIYLQTRVPGILELLQVAIGNGEGDFLTADPVTGVISVTVDEGNFYALVEDVG